MPFASIHSTYCLPTAHLRLQGSIVGCEPASQAAFSPAGAGAAELGFVLNVRTLYVSMYVSMYVYRYLMVPLPPGVTRTVRLILLDGDKRH